MTLTGALITVAVCLSFEILFSGAEIALISLNKIKLRADKKNGSQSAALIDKMLKNPEEIFGTTSVGTNIAVVVSVSTATAYLVGIYGDKGDIYATLIMSPFILLFGEIIPKSIFMELADRISHVLIYPIWLSSRLFSPILLFTSKVTKILTALFFKEKKVKNYSITREEMINVLKQGESKIDLPAGEKQMIRNIFEFRKTTVRECMVPLIDIIAINESSSLRNARKTVIGSNFSRIPIFKDRIYKIDGILHSSDLLKENNKLKSIRKLVKPAYYVPETKKINELFKELQLSKSHMAIVVDEYGGTTGVVTIEDMLEEIVGEIEDEYDDREKLFEQISDNAYIFEARMEIDAIQEKLRWDFPDGDFETIGGFLLDLFQKIPKIGESLEYKGTCYTITDADDRSVKQVRAETNSKELPKQEGEKE